MNYRNANKPSKCPCCGQIAPLRSLSQNGYWWLCMTIIGEETGNHKEVQAMEVKEHFNWFETYVNKKTGEERKVINTSVKWNKKEFSERTEQLIIWAAEQGISLPIPPDKHSEESY